MKRYRLLKDLPFAKAGEELYIKRQEDGGYFTLYKDLDKMSVCDLHEGFIENFDEWFEEVEDTEFYMPVIYADKEGVVANKISNDSVVYEPLYLNASSIGLAFKSKKEAERYIAYLKAKTIIKRDTKGFKPEWNNNGEGRYCGFWDSDDNKPNWKYGLNTPKEPNIYFKSRKDILDSFKKHPEEWKTYLTYDQ